MEMNDSLGTFEEKLRCLRNVGLFETMSDDILGGIAVSLETLSVAGGATIFTKDDPGDSLYIIASGRVRVHDGDLVFNELNQGDFFGEMALLDAAPRSATVTTQTDTVLYWLDQRHLNQLMAGQVEVARGIIQVLCGHLRNRIAERTRDFSYIRQMEQITAAAAALEAGVYAAESLAEVASREDALGNLARVFQRMVSEVQAREQRLTLQVQALRIEVDRERQARQVADITNSDFFKSLQQKVQARRDKSKSGADESTA